MKMSEVCWMKLEHLPWLTCNWARARTWKKGQREEFFHKTKVREGILNIRKVKAIAGINCDEKNLSVPISVVKDNSGENTAFDWKSNQIKKKKFPRYFAFCCDFSPHRNQVLLIYGLHIVNKKDSVGSR